LAEYWQKIGKASLSNTQAVLDCGGDIYHVMAAHQFYLWLSANFHRPRPSGLVHSKALLVLQLFPFALSLGRTNIESTTHPRITLGSS